MDIAKTVFSVRAILEQMSDKPVQSNIYLYAKGLPNQLTKPQIKQFESIIDRDYKRVKAYIKQSKSQSKQV